MTQAPTLLLLLLAAPPGTAPAPSGGGWRAITGTVAAPDAAAAARREREEGAARLREGEASAAVDRLRAALAQDPGNAELADELGYALSRLGARAEAEAMHRRAVELDPRRSTAYVNFAELLASSPERWQRREEAMAFLQRGLAALAGDTRGRQVVALAIAGFEASVGRLAAARERLKALLAEPLPLGLQKRAQDRLQAIDEEDRARALADWPEPRLARAAAAELADAEQALRHDDAAGALDRVEPVVRAHPAASGPRYLRAQALEALGRHDEASRELALLVQVRPSHALAWRLYGTILAEHGGALEAGRADEALQRALALEPSWDDLRELRRRVAHKRADRRDDGSNEQAPPAPSGTARALYDDAQRWMNVDAPEVAADSLRKALADSPAYVQAAAALYALTGEEPVATVQAIWDHGPSLARLAAEILRSRREPEVLARVRPWLERAVALGSAEARFERALLHVEAGDNAAALADLGAYVASELSPPRLAEATALRSSLDPAQGQGASPESRARTLLLADRPNEAARVLGGSCRPGLAPASLVELGRIEEYERRPARALECYRLALAPGAGEANRRAALERLALVGSYAAPVELARYTRELEQGARQGIAAADWALSRLAAAEERWPDAAARAQAFANRAAPDDPLRQRALQAARELGLRVSEHRARRSEWTRIGGIAAGALVLLVVVVLLARRWRTHSVAWALDRLPGLYPDVAAVVAEIRHDVLKHRASTLGLAAADPEARAEVRKLLHEPAPASTAVAEAYERLRRAAAVAGVTLAPLDREPVFGPLHRRLVQAEALLDRPPGGRDSAALAEIDGELRDQLGPALADLLAAAPRTRLDPADMARWMRALAGESDAGAESGEQAMDPPPRRTPLQPGLHLPALDLELPITPEALHTIVSNLVRNAVSALSASAGDPRLLLRVEEGRDAAGRQMVTFLVADSAPATLSLADIEQRDGQRGLGIVRDLVRRWGGYLVVRPEPAPFVKAVGAAFPLRPTAPPA